MALIRTFASSEHHKAESSLYCIQHKIRNTFDRDRTKIYSEEITVGVSLSHS